MGLHLFGLGEVLGCDGYFPKALYDKSTENLHTNVEELIGEDERIKKIVMDVLIDIPRGKLLEDVKSFPG